MSASTFEQLNISKNLVSSCKMLGRYAPDEADILLYPRVRYGKDTLCIGHTTAEAFVVPILETLIKSPPPIEEKSVFALIIAPTRELAMEISEHFRAYGYNLCCGFTSLVLYGSDDWDKLTKHALQASQRYIVATTPPDLHAQFSKVDGLCRCPFSFSSVRYLVIYEVDVLDEDCSKLNVLLPLPVAGNLHTYIFATHETKEVSTIQKSFLRQDSAKITLASKVHPELKLHYCICGDAKDGYVLHILRQYTTGKVVVFADECYVARKLALALSILGFKAIHIVDAMNKKEKWEAEMAFETQRSNVLICSTLASERLVLGFVDAVINYDLSVCGIRKYFYQVGRCASRGWGHTYQLLNDDEEKLQFKQSIFKFLMDKEDEDGYIDTEPIDREALALTDTQSMESTEYDAYLDATLKEGILGCTWNNISVFSVGDDQIHHLQSEARRALRKVREQIMEEQKDAKDARTKRKRGH